MLKDKSNSRGNNICVTDSERMLIKDHNISNAPNLVNNLNKSMH